MNSPVSSLGLSVAELKILMKRNVAIVISLTIGVAHERAVWLPAVILEHAPRTGMPGKVPVQLESSWRARKIGRLHAGTAG